MFNDAKYKTCVTLILVGSNPSSREQTTQENNRSSVIEMNENHLSQNVHRTFQHSDSIDASLATNERIVPIKCLSHKESSDLDQTTDIEPTSSKYCCTLEVKFVWYGHWMIDFFS